MLWEICGKRTLLEGVPKMKRLYIYCEGQSEESFVNRLLRPYLAQKSIYVFPIICRTKEGPNGVFKGGVVNYNKVVKEIQRLCAEQPHGVVTSFIDFYGLNNYPKLNIELNKYKLIDQLETRLKIDVDKLNFIPYISLHEFESLLFSDPSCFEYLSKSSVNKFNQILADFDYNPELINNGRATAPSKRILNEIKDYGKILDGTLIAEKISLSKIRERCRHFSEWIDKLEKI